MRGATLLGRLLVGAGARCAALCGPVLAASGCWQALGGSVWVGAGAWLWWALVAAGGWWGCAGGAGVLYARPPARALFILHPGVIFKG